MNLSQDTRIRDKYHKGFPRPCKITEVVVHATGGGTSSENLIGWMLKGERASEYVKGVALFHYLNDQQGNVIEIIDPINYVFHSSSGYHDFETVGIENLKPTTDNSGLLPELQLTSLCELLEELITTIPTITRIVSHDFNAAKFSGLKPKPCPGDLEWEAVMFHLTSKGFSVALESPQEIQIIR